MVYYVHGRFMNIKSIATRNVIFRYTLVGIIFGVFNFVFNRIMFDISMYVNFYHSIFNFIILSVYIPPAIYVALYEYKRSISIVKGSFSVVYTWFISHIMYYFVMVPLNDLLFATESTYPSHRLSPIFMALFWLPLNIIGGLVCGILIICIYKIIKIMQRRFAEE